MAQKAIYQLFAPPPLQVPRLKMTISQVAAHLSQDSFFREHFTNFLEVMKKTEILGAQLIAEHSGEITEFQGYEMLYHEFRRKMAAVSQNVF